MSQNRKGTGKAPESAGQSIHYALDLQKKRLEERGLQMELSFEKPRKESDYISGGSSADKRRQSLKYSNQTEYEDNTRKLFLRMESGNSMKKSGAFSIQSRLFYGMNP